MRAGLGTAGLIVSTLLAALSPAATLERGYAIVLTEDGSIVRDADAVPADAIVDIRVAHGRLAARRTDRPAG